MSHSLVKIGTLSEGTQRIITLKVKKIDNKAESGKDLWIQVRAEYMPDYNAVIHAVKNNTIAYPDENLRAQLITGLMGYQKAGETTIKTITYNFNLQ
jgi:hypothetical protein